jgi:hypothetical protein
LTCLCARNTLFRKDGGQVKTTPLVAFIINFGQSP